MWLVEVILMNSLCLTNIMIINMMPHLLGLMDLPASLSRRILSKKPFLQDLIKWICIIKNKEILKRLFNNLKIIQ